MKLTKKKKKKTVEIYEWIPKNTLVLSSTESQLANLGWSGRVSTIDLDRPTEYKVWEVIVKRVFTRPLLRY